MWVGVSVPGGWGVVCCALSTNQLFPMTHTGQRVDVTMEQGDTDLYTVSPLLRPTSHSLLFPPTTPSSITLTDTPLFVHIYHVDEFRDLEYIPVPGFIFLSNLPTVYRIFRSHRQTNSHTTFLSPRNADYCPQIWNFHAIFQPSICFAFSVLFTKTSKVT